MAEFKQINLDKKQCQEFAHAIFNDIDVYVKTHTDEFNEFLKDERSENNDKFFETR